MAKYIEREKFVRKLNYICKTYGFSKVIIEKFKKAIDDSIATDVVEVKHGKWINEEDYLYKCSLCGDKAFLRLGGKPCRYCPSCGAKMDGATDTNVGGKLKEGAEE